MQVKRAVAWATIWLQRYIARSKRLSRLYFQTLSFLSRRALPSPVARRVEALACHPSINWPHMSFRPLPVTVGSRTKIRLIPHIGEADQSALFRNRMDYESEVFEWLEREAGQYDAIIEIGANVGMYTVFFDALAKTSAHPRPHNIFCFEPSPKAFERLSANLAANGCKHVTAQRAAVGQRSGTMEFFEPEGHLTNGSLVRSFAGLFSTSIATTQVEVRGPEHIVALLERYPKVLLKIDVEGYEPELLDALQDAILEFRPHLVVEVLSETVDRLNQLGWLGECELSHLRLKSGPKTCAHLVCDSDCRDWVIRPRNIETAAPPRN